MSCPWKKPRHQGKVSTSGNQQQMNDATTNEEKFEIEQRIIIYTLALESKYIVMDYVFHKNIFLKRKYFGILL
jgi:hypothetical protein